MSLIVKNHPSAPKKEWQLKAVDRCDRCGAQAYVRATLLSGGELLFCGHHAKEYAEKLKTVSARIQDETSRIN